MWNIANVSCKWQNDPWRIYWRKWDYLKVTLAIFSIPNILLDFVERRQKADTAISRTSLYNASGFIYLSYIGKQIHEYIDYVPMKYPFLMYRLGIHRNKFGLIICFLSQCLYIEIGCLHGWSFYDYALINSCRYSIFACIRLLYIVDIIKSGSLVIKKISKMNVCCIYRS